MKVCFVVGTLGLGGAERQLVFMLQALKRLGISISVLCLTRGEHFEGEITKMGIPVEYFGNARSRVGRLMLLARKLRSERADVVQSTHFYTNLYAGVAGYMLGIPSIGAIRSDFVSEVAAHGVLGRWQTVIPRFLVTNSTLAYASALASGIPASKLGLVRNVVSSSGNGNGKRPSAPLTVLFVGRLDANKSPERFIRLAKTLLQRHRDRSLKFLVAGDGPLRGKLGEMLADVGLGEEQLEFLGAVSDIDPVYRKSHILVSTSKREGTPNVILEAMANGLPIVATRAGGTRELLNDGRGILVDQGDDAQLAEAVSSLISDSNLRDKLGRVGRDYVEQHHSVGYLEKRLPEIYERLIKNVG